MEKVKQGSPFTHRTNSMSSITSSSVAATSVIGDISEPDDEDDEQVQVSALSDKFEVDRFGFKGGEQYTNPETIIVTPSKLRKREIKWLRMLDNWNMWMAKKFPHVKNRCRKGIPPSLRGRAWQRLSGSEFLLKKNPGKYEEYVSAEADPNHLDDIEKDLHRQFPFHEMFEKRGGSGQQDLYNVLRAYTVYCPEVGYCQAQAPVVAVLLMHMPAEEAFWCMVATCEYYLQGYFSHGLEAVQTDGWVMQGLLKKVSPILYTHMQKHEVQPVLYMTEWFMCVFSRTLPWASVLRLWDIFFCEGVKVVFRCALVLLRNSLGTKEKLKHLAGLYETVEALRKIDIKYMQPDSLMFEIINLKISEKDLQSEFKSQKKKLSHEKEPVKIFKEKRIYRFTPTYTSVNIDKKINQNKKNVINNISADSATIHGQVLNTKRSSSKKKKEKLSPSDPEVAGKENVVETNGNISSDIVKDALNKSENKSDNVSVQSISNNQGVFTSFSTKLYPEAQNKAGVVPRYDVIEKAPICKVEDTIL